MSSKSLKVGMLAVLAMAGLAQAAEFQSNGTGNWSNWRMWQKWNGSAYVDLNGAGDPVPTAGDIVHIRNGNTITVDGTGVQVTTLEILSGGTLVISASKDLSLVGTTPSATVIGTFTINGSFKLDSSSGAPYLDLQTSQTMPASTGEIVGLPSAAAAPEIRVNANTAAVTMTNAGTVRSYLAIKGINNGSNNASFVNNGIVSADDGTLEVHSSLSGASDNGSALWKVEVNSGAILKFSEPVTLAGAVQMLVSGGALQISANVTTATFRYDSGTFTPSSATLAWTTVVDNCVHTPLLQNNSSLNASFSPCP